MVFDAITNCESYGLAIYFPSNMLAYTSDPRAEHGYEKTNALFPVEFVQRRKWADFLHAYLARTP